MKFVMKTRQGMWALGLLIVMAGVYMAAQRRVIYTSKIPFCDTPPPWPTEIPVRMSTSVGLHLYNWYVYKGKQNSFGMPLSSDVTCHWARVVAWRERHEEFFVSGVDTPERETIVREVLVGCIVSATNLEERILICYSASLNDSDWSDPAYGLGEETYKMLGQIPRRFDIEKNPPRQWRCYQYPTVRYSFGGRVVRTHIGRGAVLGFGVKMNETSYSDHN